MNTHRSTLEKVGAVHGFPIVGSEGATPSQALGSTRMLPEPEVEEFGMLRENLRPPTPPGSQVLRLRAFVCIFLCPQSP